MRISALRTFLKEVRQNLKPLGSLQIKDPRIKCLKEAQILNSLGSLQIKDPRNKCLKEAQNLKPLLGRPNL